MSRIQLFVVFACIVALSVGCRNRCYNTCANGAFAGSPTIAAAPTYSLQIPSLARNTQPYYTPGVGNTSASAVNPRAASPTPATPSSGDLNWRRAGTNLSGSTSRNVPNTQQPAQSVLNQPTKFVEVPTINPVNNVAQNQAGVRTPFNVPTRTASLAALPGSGQSFTNSPNYQTTRVNEQVDPTRIAVTDATSVIAPARNNPTGLVPGNFPATYNAPIQQTLVAAGNGFYVPGTPVYRGTPVIVGTQPVPNVYRGQPVLVQSGVGFPGSSAAVLAQNNTAVNSGRTGNTSTASASQVGWQRRDIGSERF